MAGLGEKIIAFFAEISELPQRVARRTQHLEQPQINTVRTTFHNNVANIISESITTARNGGQNFCYGTLKVDDESARNAVYIQFHQYLQANPLIHARIQRVIPFNGKGIGICFAKTDYTTAYQTLTAFLDNWLPEHTPTPTPLKVIFGLASAGTHRTLATLFEESHRIKHEVLLNADTLYKRPVKQAYHAAAPACAPTPATSAA